LNDLTMKLCKMCHKEKPLSSFYRARHDSYANECIDCSLLIATVDQNMNQEINNTEAISRLKSLNEQTIGLSFHEFLLDGVQRKIPVEILTRMEDLWDTTQRIGKEIIAIGKIIVMKIFDFLKANPKLAAGMAVGVIVYFLSNTIPLIGPFLAPILATIAAVYTLYKITSANEMQEMVKDFFKLLVTVFNIATQHLTAS